jgi:hypothetical protein
LPKSVLDQSWMPAPQVCGQASEQLRSMHHAWLVRNYCVNISPQRQGLMEEKVLAEQLFKGKKDNYSASVARSFVALRLSKFLFFVLFETRSVIKFDLFFLNSKMTPTVSSRSKRTSNRRTNKQSMRFK